MGVTDYDLEGQGVRFRFDEGADLMVYPTGTGFFYDEEASRTQIKAMHRYLHAHKLTLRAAIALKETPELERPTLWEHLGIV